MKVILLLPAVNIVLSYLVQSFSPPNEVIVLGFISKLFTIHIEVTMSKRYYVKDICKSMHEVVQGIHEVCQLHAGGKLTSPANQVECKSCEMYHQPGKCSYIEAMHVDLELSNIALRQDKLVENDESRFQKELDLV